MHCASCGFENQPESQFCEECGVKLARACPGCGREARPTAKFCPACGTSLARQSQVPSLKSQVEKEEADARLQTLDPRPISYTPKHLAARIRAEGEALEARGAVEGERKTITALFADVAGFTALAHDLDPEETRAIIDPALQLMMDAVHRYEGYVAQSLGDGIFALFGAPLARENHPQRTLYAALRMQEEMKRYADRLRLEKGVPLQLRVGVNTGEVVLRSIRKDDLHTDYVPVGDSTNLVARMESLATPGSIVVSQATYKLIEGYFACKSLGAAQVKGINQPVNIYEVLGVGPLRTKLQVAARRGLARFVGRQREVEQLRRAFELAKAGRGQIVGVMGEPGVGKSRLFYEFKLLSQKDCLLLETFSVSHGKAYARARELCQQVGDSLQLFPVLGGLLHFHLNRGELQGARELGEQFLNMAQGRQDSAFLLEAYYTLALALFYSGEIVSALEHAEQGIALYDPRQHRFLTFRFGDDPAVGCLTLATPALWFLGYPDQALQRSREALTLAQELAHPFSLAWALFNTAWLHQCRREVQSTQEVAEATLTLASEHGFSLWMACGVILRGWALAERRHTEEGLTQMRQGLANLRATGQEGVLTYSLAHLAEIHGQMGQTEEGLRVVTEALAIVDKTEERLYEAELYRLKGELVLQSGVRCLESENTSPQPPTPSPQAEAEGCFWRAIEIARKQQAKSWELRAAMSLTRLWQQQGKQQEAHRLLSEIYDWFTEGFDTKDLQEAKALLDELFLILIGGKGNLVDWTRTQGSLKAAQLCIEQQLFDSAVSRAYFAVFQAAICALESHGIIHKEWTHKGVHNDFVHRFVRRRKIVPASFASALPNLMRLRHTGDYRQPGVSQRQAERAVRLAREFVELLITEVWHAQETPE